MYVCLFAYGHTPKRTETKENVAFQICARAKAFYCSVWWMRQRALHCVTQCRWIYWVWETDCVWSERKGLLLDCSTGTGENRKAIGANRRQARLGRQCVHGEESVAFSQCSTFSGYYIVSVEAFIYSGFRARQKFWLFVLFCFVLSILIKQVGLTYWVFPLQLSTACF